MPETFQSSPGESHSRELRNSAYVYNLMWVDYLFTVFSLSPFSFPSIEASVLPSNTPNERTTISLHYLNASLIAILLHARKSHDVISWRKKKKEKRLAGTEENLVVRVWEVKLWNRMFVVVRFPERQMRWDSRPSRTPRCPQVGPARVSIGPDWSGISHIIRPIFSIARPAHLLPLPSPRPPRLPTCLKPLPAYWPKSVDFERTHQPLRRLTCQDTSSGSSLMWRGRIFRTPNLVFVTF